MALRARREVQGALRRLDGDLPQRRDADHHLRARVAKLETELDGAKQSLNSFFSMKIRAEEEGTKVLDESISTYLRRAENGGMPDEEVDLVRSVVNDAARIYLWNALVPIIRGIASSAQKDSNP